MLQRGKSRTVGERIVQGEPPAFEQWTSEQPVQWTFSLAYTRSDAATFWAFVVANRGRWFNMPIRVEQGYIVHAVRFLPGFPQLASESAEVLTYNCKAEARRIVRPIDPAEIAEYAGIGANDLDIAINIAWPEQPNFPGSTLILGTDVVLYNGVEVLYG